MNHIVNRGGTGRVGDLGQLQGSASSDSGSERTAPASHRPRTSPRGVRWRLSTTLCCLLLAIGFESLGGAVEGLELKQSTIDNGGGRIAAADVAVTSSIGQHDASRSPSSGSRFVVSGGFWRSDDAEMANGGELIFRSGFEAPPALHLSDAEVAE